jgi:anti-sigma B factor antagonist
MAISSTQLQSETTQNGGIRLFLVGDIDMTFTVEHQAALEELVAQPPPELEFDASGLIFIDSTGLRALATLATCVRSAGGDVRTTHSSEPFRRIIEVTGLSERFGLVART